MPEYFDTHCHLYYNSYDNDILDVIKFAKSNGVTRILVPGIDEDSSRKASQLAASHSGVFASVGLQPNESPEYPDTFIEKLAELTIQPRVIAIGETGLDFYRTETPRETQYDRLARQLELAEKLAYPIILHSRGAERELLEYLVDKNPNIPVIFHCYTGLLETALKVAGEGYYLSFAGPVTFSKGEYLREIVKNIPPEQILIETDGPFMSPEPLRGKRNEPAYVRHIADVIADVMGTSQEATAAQLTQNAERAFLLGEHRRTDLVYSLYGRIYMNITGKCDNRCTFCIKNRQDGIGGYYLRHKTEPDSGQLENIIDVLMPEWAGELVFCGFGEPTMRPVLLGKLAGRAKKKGFRTRLNTNGLCLSRMSTDEAMLFLKCFDTVSISLNASNEDEYNRVCQPSDKKAWKHLHEFITLAEKTCSIHLTAVRNSNIDMRRVQKHAEEMNFSLRIRG